MEVNKEKMNGKTNDIALSVQNPKLKSEISDTKVTTNKEVPNIRLSPEQIEEIHADEYSLTLFYATRVEPLSVAEIKKQFPEPESKKAQSALDRFVKVGLIHITPDGKYYSNYPENYINYSNYRYDSDLEAKKDSKVFGLMKEFTGNKEYWKNRSYFSMDAFYTQEQTKELQEMLFQVKIKAKEYANENAKKKSIRGLFFRRLKFYDMMFSMLIGIFLFVGITNPANAGGNDPTIMAKVANYQDWIIRQEILFSGGGNDPTMPMRFAASESPYQSASLGFVVQKPFTAMSFSKVGVTGLSDLVLPIHFIEDNEDGSFDGGGGHDPTCVYPRAGGGGHDPTTPGEKTKRKPICCIFSTDGEQIPVYTRLLCNAQSLLVDLAICEQGDGKNCSVIEDELIDALSQPSLTPKSNDGSW